MFKRAIWSISVLLAAFLPGYGNSQVFTPSVEATYGFSYSAQSRHAGGSPSFLLPGSLSYKPFRWFTIKGEANTLKAIPQPSLPWISGVGDAFLGGTVATLENEKLPSFSFNYRIKFPTADVQAKLGTGKYDHRLLFGAAKKFNDRWSGQVGAGDQMTGNVRNGYDQRAVFTAAGTYSFKAPGVQFGTELDFLPSSNITTATAVATKAADCFLVSTLTFPIKGMLTFRGVATTGITPYTAAAGISGSLVYKIEVKR